MRNCALLKGWHRQRVGLASAIALIASLTMASGASAWSYAGHRAITTIAMERLPSDMPAFLRDPEAVRRMGEQANEPDRWRGLRNAYLSHENAPDHFIDIEDLEGFGLTLRTIPRMRLDYLAQMAVAASKNPEKLPAYDESKDWDRTKRWPGFLPHAILEHYSKLQSSLNTYRILEALVAEARVDPKYLDQARENAIFHLGTLSHFVGDTSQPLHTTRHYNGWVGDNPKGYTTDRGFHSSIDSGIVNFHKLDEAAIREVASKLDAPTLHGADPWEDVIAYIERSFDRVVPLYELQKSGELKGASGKEFIGTCLADASVMLAALVRSAWETSAPTDEQVAGFIRNMPFVTTPLTISAPKRGAGGAETPGAK